jgi:N,N'-diacetyllegionaminate synthase
MIFVAEIGMNHNGNFDLAYELIRQAKIAGADIAKFQFGWRDKPGDINFIDQKTAIKLKKWCDYFEIEMMASIISEDAIDLAIAANLKRIKIASRTVIENPKLVENLINQGKEIFISLGMYDSKLWPFGEPSEQIRYIYCRSSYPCYPQELVNMPIEFSEARYYGYSDHLHGTEACLVAIARGAKFIEKHFTLNRTSDVIRDHTLSATPEELESLIKNGRAISRLVNVIGSKK